MAGTPDFETVSFTAQGEVATLRLLRDRINVRQIREMERVCDQLEDQLAASGTKILLIQGRSEGIDFADFDPKEGLDIHGFNKWEKLVHRFETLPMLTIFLADGPLSGGGVQLMLACDLRLALPGVALSLPEVRMGFLPGMSTWRLARFVGMGRARRMILTGEVVTAEEAAQIGLIDSVEPDAAALDRWLPRLQPVHPVAVQLARRLLLESASAPFEEAIGNFLAAQHRAISQSAFLDTLKKKRQAP